MTASRLYRVESFVAGLAIKAPCRVATNAEIVLSGIQTVNGHVGQEGDRILVKDQTNAVENGVYTMETSAWRRDGDFDGSRDLVGGTIVPVWDYGVGGIVQYAIDGQPAKVTPDIDAITFSVFYNSGGAIENDTLQTVTVRGNTTDQGIVLLTPDLADSVTFLVDDTEQAFPFLEVDSSAPVEVYRFNKPTWHINGVYVSGVGSRGLYFYGYGDAVSGSIVHASNNITLTALGDYNLILGGQFNINGYPINDFTIQHQSIVSTAGVLTLDYNTGQSKDLTLNENITLVSFSNLPPVTNKLLQIEIEIIQDATIAYTISWPGSVLFAAGTAPDLSTLSSRHLVHLRSRNGGTTWLLLHAAEFA